MIGASGLSPASWAPIWRSIPGAMSLSSSGSFAHSPCHRHCSCGRGPQLAQGPALLCHRSPTMTSRYIHLAEGRTNFQDRATARWTRTPARQSLPSQAETARPRRLQRRREVSRCLQVGSRFLPPGLRLIASWGHREKLQSTRERLSASLV
jgi:hypothetical protein